jgi:hypothetical protein
MRFKEFDLTEDQQKEMLRKKYPHLTEEQLDEILPAIAAIGRVAGTAIARGAGALAKGAAKGVGALGKAAGRVGTKMGQAAAQGAKTATQKAAVKAGQKATDMVANKMLKRGAKLSLPTQGPGNKEQEFQIDAVAGDEVTIKNPKPKPGEPAKTVYKKKDLEPIIKQKAGL